MLKKLSEALRPKFPVTTSGCSMVKIARLDETFLEVSYSQASRVEGQSLQQEKKRKDEKGKAKEEFKKKSLKT